MNFNGKGLLVLIVIMMYGLLTAAPADQQNRNRNLDVERTYNAIRNAPLLYDYEESIVEFTNEGMRLEGTLMVPKNGKKSR